MANHFHSFIFPICKWKEKGRIDRKIKTSYLLGQVSYMSLLSSSQQLLNPFYKQHFWGSKSLSHLLWHIASMVITIGFLQFLLPTTQENIILNGLSDRLNVKIKEKEDIKEGFRWISQGVPCCRDASGCDTCRHKHKGVSSDDFGTSSGFLGL